MHAYKTTIDFEKLTYKAIGGISSEISSAVRRAAGSNYYLQDMGRPVFEFEVEFLNSQEIDDQSLNDLVDNLPNLNKNSNYEIFTGITYNFKFDLYKLRCNRLLKDTINRIHVKGGRVETFTSQRLTDEEARGLLDVDFYVDYS